MTTKKTAKKTNKQAVKKTAKKQAENKHVPTWNNVKGLMRVWASEWKKSKHETYLTFSTSLGKKNENDDYDNLYFDVIFKKGEAPDVEEGAFEIKVKKGFLTLKVYNDDSIHPAVMVMDYDLVNDVDDDDVDDDDDLPF